MVFAITDLSAAYPQRKCGIIYRVECCILKQLEESVFSGVGFSSKLLFSLAPCERAMVARSEQKF